MVGQEDSPPAHGMVFTINFMIPAINQRLAVEMSMPTLGNIEGFLSENPDVIISINSGDLDLPIMSQATLDRQLRAGIGAASNK